MRIRRGAALAAGALAAFVTAGALLLALDEGNGVNLPDLFATSGDDSTTVRCTGSVVELDFDPEGRIEARVSGKTVASADVEDRRLGESCVKAPTQDSWSQGGLRYTTIKNRTTLTCHFPGRFYVHTHSVSASWAGERRVGSAVYLVLGKRVRPGPGPQRTIFASASVVERADESDVVFAPRYCTTS
jgi:hypothetical protein